MGDWYKDLDEIKTMAPELMHKYCIRPVDEKLFKKYKAAACDPKLPVSARNLDAMVYWYLGIADKEIPKQVDLKGDGYADGELVYDMADCPNPDCQHFFEDSDENWGCTYCPDCGQKLRW